METNLNFPSNPKEMLHRGYDKIGAFQKELISALVSMVKDDDLFAYYEYERLFITVDSIIDIFTEKNETEENKKNDRTLIHNFVYSEIINNCEKDNGFIKFEKFVKEIKTQLKENKDKIAFNKILIAVFEIILPLIKSQTKLDSKIDKWAEILGAKEESTELINENKCDNEEKNFFSSLLNVAKKVTLIKGNSEQRIQNKEIEMLFITLCEPFEELNKYSIELKKSEITNKRKIEVFKLIKERILDHSQEMIPKEKHLEDLKELSKKYVIIIQAFVAQIQNRIDTIGPRLVFQQKLLNQDYEQFKRFCLAKFHSKLASEIELKDIKFGEHSGLFIDKWDNLKSRHQEIFDLWYLEINAFEKELKVLSNEIRNRVFVDVNKDALQNVLENKFRMYSFKNKLDNISKKISIGADLLTVAGVGGAASGVFAVSALTGLLTNPVGLTVIGVIGVSAVMAKIWQKVGDENKRRKEEQEKMVEKFEKHFEVVFPNPEEAYQKELADLLNNFIFYAKKYYEPLFLNVVLLSSETEYRKIIFAKMKEDTEEALNIQISNYQE